MSRAEVLVRTASINLVNNGCAILSLAGVGVDQRSALLTLEKAEGSLRKGGSNATGSDLARSTGDDTVGSRRGPADSDRHHRLRHVARAGIHEAVQRSQS